MKASLILLVVFGLSPVMGAVETFRWVAAEDGNWFEPGNWDRGAVPDGPEAVVVFGKDGFSEKAAVRTVQLDQGVTVAAVEFENTAGGIAEEEGATRARAYRISGSGKITFEAAEGVARLLGHDSGQGDRPHEIAVSVGIASPLRVTASQASGRSLLISGEVDGVDGNPARIEIVGRSAGAALRLEGRNRFGEGEISIAESGWLSLGAPDAARGSAIRFSGESEVSRRGLQLAGDKWKHVVFEGNGVDVEEDGTISVQRIASRYEDLSGGSAIYNWSERTSPGSVGFPSIRVRSGRSLVLQHQMDNQDLVIQPGHEVFLEAGSTLKITAVQHRRHLHFHIGPESVLRGEGTVLAEYPSLDPDKRGNTPVYIDALGTVAPGGREKPGILRLGKMMGTEGDHVQVFFEPQSRLQFRINGPQPGRDHDQILLNGTITLDETELMLSATHTYQRTDRVFLIVVEKGAIEGSFSNVAGGVVTFPGPNGRTIRARLSLSGSVAKRSLEGGSDLVLHDFH